MIERKKIEAILKGVNQSVSRLDAAMIERVVEPQVDKLDKLHFSLVFDVDATTNDPKLSAQLTYGGRKYKELL
jgi:hypothetical protein